MSAKEEWDIVKEISRWKQNENTILKQFGSWIDHMHSGGFMHRDLFFAVFSVSVFELHQSGRAEAVEDICEIMESYIDSVTGEKGEIIDVRVVH